MARAYYAYLFVLILPFLACGCQNKPPKAYLSQEIVQDTWRGYKHFFVQEDGKVYRPKDRDVVSEGQAYAILRAVWMGDKDTFDLCYRWTENNLSRRNFTGDNLLAWRWKDGAVADWMPASDADIDYALALILAHRKWGRLHPADMEGYADKARSILRDIFQYLTFRDTRGRLYLLPWIVDNPIPEKTYPQNPSYYSPAHFRIFYEETEDIRWLELADTAYYMLETLSGNFAGREGVGLIPDWCSVDADGGFGILEGKSPDFGWEAVRVPLRIYLDFFWFNENRAGDFLRSSIFTFLQKELSKRGLIYSEYSYNDSPAGNLYENPLFYAAYYCVFLANDSADAPLILEKVRGYLKRVDGELVYMSGEEYFVNSLAWLAEGFRADIITQ